MGSPRGPWGQEVGTLRTRGVEDFPEAARAWMEREEEEGGQKEGRSVERGRQREEPRGGSCMVLGDGSVLSAPRCSDAGKLPDRDMELRGRGSWKPGKPG